MVKLNYSIMQFVFHQILYWKWKKKYNKYIYLSYVIVANYKHLDSSQ